MLFCPTEFSVIFPLAALASQRAENHTKEAKGACASAYKYTQKRFWHYKYLGQKSSLSFMLLGDKKKEFQHPKQNSMWDIGVADKV